MPAIRTTPRRSLTSPNAVFATRSVVMMARAASSNRSGRNPSTRHGIAPVIFLGSSSTPITPVEAGRTCATGILSTPAAAALLATAAFTGNAVNYTIGRVVGPRVFSASDRAGLTHRLLNHEHLDRAHAFFEQYGGKAIVLGRFVPIVRTFVPFVAGAAQMTSGSFVFYNVIGATAWVGLCVGAGWLFGNVPLVKENFSLVTIGIVFVSILPMLVEYVRHRRAG